MSKKKKLGQFYTTKNPFIGDAFCLWNSVRPQGTEVLEPFAGAGNLFSFLSESWVGFDIEPNHLSIKQKDTISDFPTGYKVCITNPPYLAKNSASRLNLSVPIKNEDLYLDCVELMLNNCEYIAAIIPSTFYALNKFRDRLIAWDKLDYRLFNDTDNPVGVAYFGPDKYETKIFVNGMEVEKNDLIGDSKLKFNVSYGNYILSAIDKTGTENLKVEEVYESFDRGKYLKDTSRNYVLFYSENKIDCNKVNNFISEWRKNTNDFYLTSFKSMMKSGKYRKRLSFSQISSIIKVVEGT